MIRTGHDNSVKFFTGTEVEHTPALGKKTLFVVGVQSADHIASNLANCEHKIGRAHVELQSQR